MKQLYDDEYMTAFCLGGNNNNKKKTVRAFAERLLLDWNQWSIL